jgi:hypothetical protein
MPAMIAGRLPDHVLLLIPVEAAFLVFHATVFLFILAQKFKGTPQMSHAFYTIYLLQCCGNYANYGLVSRLLQAWQEVTPFEDAFVPMPMKMPMKRCMVRRRPAPYSHPLLFRRYAKDVTPNGFEMAEFPQMGIVPCRFHWQRCGIFVKRERRKTRWERKDGTGFIAEA